MNATPTLHPVGLLAVGWSCLFSMTVCGIHARPAKHAVSRRGRGRLLAANRAGVV
jgi:hypothetical protein